MRYLLFSYPSCLKCDDLKNAMVKYPLEGEEYSLVSKDGRDKIRQFLGYVKRDDKGGIIIPTLMIQEEGRVVSILNSREELEAWLRSRD